MGGDSRFGVSNALSSSPTKSSALPLPIPIPGPPSAGRRGHAHRRSAAISSHDISSFMQPEPVPRLSHSLPTTPMELPGQTPPLDRSISAPDVNEGIADPFGPPLDDMPTRPPSRPRVQFDENVVTIPRARPLSTISSGTESSMSTIRGHSVNNSISSVISMNTPSPPASRTPRTSISSTMEDVSNARAKSSLEISKRVEKEGEWLKSRSSGSLKRPHSETMEPTSTTSFVEPEIVARPRQQHNKKHSISHALGLDRRRSEPTIGMNANPSSRLSAISLQESNSAPAAVIDHEAGQSEHVSSARKIKQWAASKISKRSKEPNRVLITSSSGSSLRPVSECSMFVPGKVHVPETAVAETNLDAVFNSYGTANEDPRPISQARTELSTPTPSQHSSFHSYEADDDPTSMLDLDAALGPFKTPPIGSQRQRKKELHSNRLTKDFGGPGGHYHRRAESAPALPPFDSARVTTPAQSSMADVFEEEEEDTDTLPPPRAASIAASATSGAEEDSSMGVEIVDLDNTEQDAYSEHAAEMGLGIHRVEWEPERPSTSHSNVASRLSMTFMDHRGSSVIDDTIMEESSPVEAIEIVESHEEPRTSSLTKSSDSSETPTVLGAPGGLLVLPDGTQSTMTPDTYQTSTFSSPDFGQRQTSFDTSRLGTSASSIADNRTMSSCATGEPGQEHRASVDDVPSLTSSRSTMLSTAHANSSRRDFSNVSDTSTTPSATPRPINPAVAAARRRKRSSIQSLSQLMGGPFGARPKTGDEMRPVTAIDPGATVQEPKKKEHRLKKLMFWKSKQQSKA